MRAPRMGLGIQTAFFAPVPGQQPGWHPGADAGVNPTKRGGGHVSMSPLSAYDFFRVLLGGTAVILPTTLVEMPWVDMTRKAMSSEAGRLSLMALVLRLSRCTSRVTQATAGPLRRLRKQTSRTAGNEGVDDRSDTAVKVSITLFVALSQTSSLAPTLHNVNVIQSRAPETDPMTTVRPVPLSFYTSPNAQQGFGL